MWIIYYGFTVLLWIKNDGKHLLFVLFVIRAFDLMSSIYLITWIYFPLSSWFVFISLHIHIYAEHPFSFHMFKMLGRFFLVLVLLLFSGKSSLSISTRNYVSIIPNFVWHSQIGWGRADTYTSNKENIKQQQKNNNQKSPTQKHLNQFVLFIANDRIK